MSGYKNLLMGISKCRTARCRQVTLLQRINFRHICNCRFGNTQKLIWKNLLQFVEPLFRLIYFISCVNLNYCSFGFSPIFCIAKHRGEG